jgi:N-methyl-L-proline demethylase
VRHDHLRFRRSAAAALPLKHLTLRNRILSTAHEPAYSEDGLPKERYRLYHAEKARGGIALTMTAGSAVVSRDSPEAFGNLHAYKRRDRALAQGGTGR